MECVCGLSVSTCVAAINMLVTNGDIKNLLTCLEDKRSQLNDVCPQYIDAYLHHLTQLKNNRVNTGETITHTQVRQYLQTLHTGEAMYRQIMYTGETITHTGETVSTDIRHR